MSSRGSVRRTDDQVQVNVQLIDAETGAHLWADRFETDRTNLKKAQNEITGRLAKTLNVELFQAASRGIEQERATDPDARDFAMRAWARVLRGPPSPATFEEALRLNERALEIDPESVEAKINMASILVGNLSNGWSSSIQQDQEQAQLGTLALGSSRIGSQQTRRWRKQSGANSSLKAEIPC